MDSTQPIAGDLLHFIDRHVQSVDQLEILLLVWKERGRTWTPAQVSAELRSNADAAEARLAAMVEQKLVVRGGDGSYRYEPAEAVDQIVGRLDEAYRMYRLRVIERIFSKPDGLSAFADAFRFRKGR